MKFAITLFLLLFEGDPERIELEGVYEDQDTCVEYTRSEDFVAAADIIFTRRPEIWMIQPLCKPVGAES